MIRYPDILRPMLVAGNKREQAASFEMVQPRSGPAYKKKVSRDQPVFFNATFRFSGEQKMIFKLWFDEALEGGFKPFLMNIVTEFGEVEHECQFLPESLMSATKEADVWTYTATIRIRELLKPDYFPNDIYEHPEAFLQRGVLDKIVNTKMPKV